MDSSYYRPVQFPFVHIPRAVREKCLAVRGQVPPPNQAPFERNYLRKK